MYSDFWTSTTAAIELVPLMVNLLPVPLSPTGLQDIFTWIGHCGPRGLHIIITIYTVLSSYFLHLSSRPLWPPRPSFQCSFMPGLQILFICTCWPPMAAYGLSNGRLQPACYHNPTYSNNISRSLCYVCIVESYHVLYIILINIITIIKFVSPFIE